MYTLACPTIDFRYDTVYPAGGGGITASSFEFPSQLLNNSKPLALLSFGYAQTMSS